MKPRTVLQSLWANIQKNTFVPEPEYSDQFEHQEFLIECDPFTIEGSVTFEMKYEWGCPGRPDGYELNGIRIDSLGLFDEYGNELTPDQKHEIDWLTKEIEKLILNEIQK